MELIIAILFSFLALSTAEINYPSIEYIPRITNGEIARPHQFPYQVGMIISVNYLRIFCGGSLISNEYVMTAAHCIFRADFAIISLGAHFSGVDKKDPNALEFVVRKTNFIIHPDWSNDGLEIKNDIALIRLPEKVTFNEFIKQISLPTWSQVKEDFVGKEVVASGWGKDSDEAKSVSPVLRYAKFPIIGKWRCSIRYLFQIEDTNICTSGRGGINICSGDSGGPLVYEAENGTKTLVGITSFGLKWGCEIGWPGVYTRVTSYLDWISQHASITIRDN